MKKITYDKLEIGQYIKVISGKEIDFGCVYVGKVIRFLDVDNLYSFQCIYADENGNPDTYLLVYSDDKIFQLTLEEVMVYAI